MFKNTNIIIFAIKKKIVLSFLLVSCMLSNNFAQQPQLLHDTLVQKFYTVNHQQLFWLSSAKNMKRAFDWLTIIESADHMGLRSNKPVINQIRTAFYDNFSIDSLFIAQTDRLITAMVLDFIKDLQQGYLAFDYDEISINRDTVYMYQLMKFRKRGAVSKIVSKLECKDHDYLVLKKYLNDSITEKDTLKYKTVLLAMNYRRFLTFFHQDEYITVNIPFAEAEYYRNDSLLLKMRTIVGKKKTPTPTIASNITAIVCFPSWSVPFSIAVNEILPKVQQNENYLEQHNFEVVDAKSNAVDESELNWESFNEKNFPYYFRQSTGSDNALGVLKFDLQNPFSIFLHATSWQAAFAKENRFLSHGCIRLEKPFELADALLKGKIDIKELKNGKKNTASNTIKLDHKIPCFIIYLPLTINGNNVVFQEDVYGLIK
jgi:murein L,D-transpeptidase YcbB/YkuD